MGHQVRARRVRQDRASRRAGRDRHPEPRAEHDDRLVRRRAGRSRRVLAGGADDWHARRRGLRPLARGSRRRRISTTWLRSWRSTPAASSTSRWSSSTRPTRSRCAAPTTPASCSCARPESRGTASTAPTSTSWTSPSEQYSFNDHAYRRFTETIKDALDPNGILMPGRHGIWPASMRNGPRG